MHTKIAITIKYKYVLNLIWINFTNKTNACAIIILQTNKSHFVFVCNWQVTKRRIAL